MSNERKIIEALASLETDSRWIREALERIEARAAEDRGQFNAHELSDAEQHSALHARVNRLLGGLSLGGFLLAGFGLPWLLGLLG